jgi:hypothetical protein
MLDGNPWISVSNASATAPASLVFTVSYGNLPNGSTVNYYTSGGQAGYDYSPASGSFGASGSGSTTVNVSTLVDNMSGSDTMSLFAYGSSGANGSGTGTIYESGGSGGDSYADSQSGAAPSNLSISVNSTTVPEGSQVSLNGSFQDSDFEQDTFSGSINWGDGQTTQLNGLTNAGFQRSHVYSEAGTYTASATVTDDDNQSVSGSIVLQITDPVPTLSGFAVSGAAEGSPAWVYGTISDPSYGDTYSAVINWGDGSTQSASYGNNQPINQSHIYQEAGTYTVSATITDEDGKSSTSSQSVVITDPTPQVSVWPSISPIHEGQSTSVTVQFTDATVDSHTVTVAWGDGTSTTASLSPGQSQYTSTSHQYTQPGTYTIVATVADDDGKTGSGQTTLVVDDPTPTIPSFMPSQTSIREGGSISLSGSFNDPSVGDTHTVTINWGDGTTSAATVTETSQTFVTGNHRYVDEPATGGAYTITAAVSDEAGKTGTATTSVSVSDAPISNVQVSPSTNSTDPVSGISVSGSFTDAAGNADVHTVTINWGDGTSDSASVNEAAQTFTSPQHQYLQAPPGTTTYTITVIVSDEDGTTASGSTSVTVANPGVRDGVFYSLSIFAPQSHAYEESADAAVLTITRDRLGGEGLQIVGFQASGTAVQGTDYYLQGTDWLGGNGSVAGYAVFYPGVMTVTIQVVPIDDNGILDPNKTMQLSLASYEVGSFRLSPTPPPTVTIVDDDPPTVTVQATQNTANEETGATATFTVSRNGPTTNPLTVNYAVTGTALAGVDVQTLPGSVTIPAGSSSTAITVSPLDDGRINSVRQAIVVPTAQSGTYTLTVGGSDTTTPLNYNATAAQCNPPWPLWPMWAAATYRWSVRAAGPIPSSSRSSADLPTK